MELYYTPPPTIKKEVKSHTVTIYLVLLKIIKGHVALDWVIWGYKKRLLWNELKFLWLENCFRSRKSWYVSKLLGFFFTLSTIKHRPSFCDWLNKIWKFRLNIIGHRTCKSIVKEKTTLLNYSVCFRQMHRRLQLKSTIGFLSQIRQMSNQFHFHEFELKLFCLSSCYCVSYSEFDHSISFWVESNSFVTLITYLAYRHSFSWHTRLKKRLRIWMLFWWIVKLNYCCLVVKLAAHLPKLTEKTYIIRVRNYLFLKNYRLLQREPFLTICYSINSSPLLVTK